MSSFSDRCALSRDKAAPFRYNVAYSIHLINDSIRLTLIYNGRYAVPRGLPSRTIGLFGFLTPELAACTMLCHFLCCCAQPSAFNARDLI